MILHDDLESMCTEVAEAYFKVLFQHLTAKTEENHKKPVRITCLWAEN
jgi:hypothetical protein